MEYLVNPMEVSGIICKSGGESPCSGEGSTFSCKCYSGSRNCSGPAYVDINVPVCPSKSVCQCKGGREACGNGGYSPMSLTSPPL